MHVDFIEYPSVMLLSHTPNPERVIAAAAKLCYSTKNPEELYQDLTDEDISKFIKRLMQMNHFSPFEHATFTFGITNMSRSCLAQITRHRIASFSVKSQRYVDYRKNPVALIPIDIRGTESEEAFKKATAEEFERYSEMVDTLMYEHMYSFIIENEHLDGLSEALKDQDINKVEIVKSYKKSFPSDDGVNIKALQFDREWKRFEKIAFENARALLPNSAATSMILTMNVRALFEFFNKRCCNRAQDEIRHVAWDMLHLVQGVSSDIFENAGPECLRGACPERGMSCGKPYQPITNQFVIK